MEEVGRRMGERMKEHRAGSVELLRFRKSTEGRQEPGSHAPVTASTSVVWAGT